MRLPRFLAALGLSVAAHGSFASTGITVFYLDKNYLPVVRIDRLAPIPESTRAVLALYALQNGAGCEGRNGAGLQCSLTSALGFPAQCSAEHVAFVRKWFPGPIPALNTRGSPKELESPQVPGTLEALCYGQPDTASWQNIWEVIRVSSAGDVVTVQAVGSWSSQNGSGKFSYTTSFRVSAGSVVLVSNRETRRD
jgi:hypothetical protein